MVADHRRHHSLEFEQVEARVVEIADAIAHAMYFRFSSSLHHQWVVEQEQVVELEAILAVVQADLVVQEVTEVNRDQKERQDHQGREMLAEMDDWSHLLLRVQV